MRHYTYNTSCVDSVFVSALHAMIDEAREVTLETIRRHCVGIEMWEKSMGYDIQNERGGRRLKNDPHVSYHKSVFRGRPCFYIRHSAIEYIWTKMLGETAKKTTARKPVLATKETIN
jgi:hypothetical protein